MTRMVNALRCRNLPFSVEEVKRITNSCRTCSEIKPRFYKPQTGVLIKATQPFERLNLDFKGPLPSKTRNRYISTVVDECPRFPFGFPCSDISAAAIIQCLCPLFAIFRAPAYIHSGRGASFLSEQLRQFPQERRVAISRITPYNPKGNGQCERYNGIVWKTVQLAASNNGCSIDNWEDPLPVALYAIRSLLCTATNATPHERFSPFQRRIASEDRPTPPDTEAPLPEDHGTEIAPDTSSNDTVSVEALSDTSDGPIPESQTDEGPAPKKRVHPETDSDAERPAPLGRKHFGASYFRAHRQARIEESPCSSTPTTNHGLPRRSLRARREPGHLRDFLPYQWEIWWGRMLWIWIISSLIIQAIKAVHFRSSSRRVVRFLIE